MVSLKYFFDLDHLLLHHTFLFAFVALALCKLLLTRIVAAFRDSMDGVRNDWAEIRELMASTHAKWLNSKLHYQVARAVQGLRERLSNLSEQDLRLK